MNGEDGYPDLREGCRRHPNPEDAVSEVVGVILLIALTAMAVALVAVVLFSQAAPEKIPDVNFLVGSNYPPTTLYLYHNGGDMLRIGTFQVLVDGTSRPYVLEGGGEFWTLGDRLDVDISTLSAAPRSVTLVYNATGQGAVAIRSAPVNTSTAPGTVKPDVIITPAPSGSCALCNLSLCPDLIASEYLSNITGDYILFGRDSRADIPASPSGGFFNFTITKPGSSIQIQSVTPLPLSLSTGDKVSIGQRANTGYKIFSIGGEIWVLWGTHLDVRITFAKNGTTLLYSNQQVSNGWITGSKIDSSLDITTASSGNSNMLLVMNDSIRINGDNSSNIVLSNIRPLNSGLFSLAHDANSNVYFIGKADSVTINGIAVK